MVQAQKILTILTSLPAGHDSARRDKSQFRLAPAAKWPALPIAERKHQILPPRGRIADSVRLTFMQLAGVGTLR